MECIECGKKLSDICPECFENLMAEAIHKLEEERRLEGKRFKLVPIDETES